ncbi:MAG TPA: DinB family protein [Anaerolineaceae bacterium]|nr:DinB family protein [Anaerolineaceae bacterium]
MITAKEYQTMLEGNLEIIKEQIQGVSNSEMLIQPPNGGNCMLWTLGHLTESLISILGFLGGEKPEGLDDLNRYKRGSEPILGPEPGLMMASELMDAYAELHQAVLERISPMTDADFDEEIPGFGRPARRGWMLFFMEFHHAYHIGQLELLRNLAGHTEKII